MNAMAQPQHLQAEHLLEVLLHQLTAASIVFSFLEHKNTENTVIFAKSILIGVPVSYLFFLPFFFAKNLNMNFWLIYLIGIALLVIGYFVHKYIMSLI